MDEKGLGFLDEESPRIVMFCGKGGVGKTTCAATTALHLALGGRRVLLISTDPTPSLSDILERGVGGEITPIEEVRGLSAVELDYDTIMEMWKEKFGREIYEVVSSFLPVEEEIIEYVAGAPGIDQEFALSYVYDLYTNGYYNTIVWDTAPAGGTLSLLKLQDKFYRHLGEAARMYVRVRRALEALRRRKVKKDPLEVIAEWEKLAKDVLDMLKEETTKAIVVTIPEALGVNQTERVVRELEDFGIGVSGILINYVLTPEIATTDFTKSRFEMQRKYIEVLQERYAETAHIITLPLLPFEVKGLKAIGEVEKILFPQ